MGAVSILAVYAVALRGSNGGRIYPSLWREIFCLFVVRPQAAYKVKDGFAQEYSEMGQTFAWILFNKHFAALPFLLLRPVSPGNSTA